MSGFKLQQKPQFTTIGRSVPVTKLLPYCQTLMVTTGGSGHTVRRPLLAERAVSRDAELSKFQERQENKSTVETSTDTLYFDSRHLPFLKFLSALPYFAAEKTKVLLGKCPYRAAPSFPVLLLSLAVRTFLVVKLSPLSVSHFSNLVHHTHTHTHCSSTHDDAT